MAIERIFVKEGIKKADVEEFLAKRFEKAGYSHTEIQRTPLGTRIIVYAHKPGLVIGRSGKKIKDITEEIKEKFGFENPLLDVREVEQPFLDANIVAKRVARALEKGINFKKVANYYLDRVMEAGAIGVQIRIAGKLAGSERSRFQKFRKGFVAFSGEYADALVEKGYAQAMIKPGIIGIKTYIMKKMPKELVIEKEQEKSEIKQ
ncbi:MAG: 30S ribosomal protein S3 [Candidatus Aenigmarchaeota archaeon]|nr:30S ribosomal protein S3 [Candidatus Aenigmarchaeota archaeon]